jgi:hypothetical protein
MRANFLNGLYPVSADEAWKIHQGAIQMLQAIHVTKLTIINRCRWKRSSQQAALFEERSK